MLYVDDIFVLYRSPHNLKKFNEYLNTKYINIRFTNKNEINGSLRFLEILILQNNKSFTTAVLIVSSIFNCFIAGKYKNGLIFTLLFRLFLTVLDIFNYHEKENCLKDVSKKNYFSTILIEKCGRMFSNQ